MISTNPFPMLRIVFFIILSLLLLPIKGLQAQHAQYKIENFTPKEYGRTYEATNLAITQSEDGLIYTGNASGILEYDAKNWNYLSVNKPLWITSLFVDSLSEDIFVGGQNEFGFFRSNKRGKLIYYSLSDSLHNEQKSFSAIVKIHKLNNSVVFQAPEKIFICENNQISILRPKSSFHLSFNVKDKIYVRQKAMGLMLIDKDSLKLISSDWVFKNEGVFAIIPFANSYMVATHESGLFLFNTITNELTPFKTSFDDYLKQAKVYGGIKLHDDHIALITLNGGLVILKQSGELISIISKTQGLIGNDIKDIYQDKHQNIWLALQNGISRIDYNNPISIYGEETGISGSVQSIVRFQDLLCVGTSNGLYIQKNASENTELEQFYKVPNFTKQVWNLTQVNQSLIVGTNEGLYLYKNDKLQLISKLNARAVYYESGFFFVAGNHGLALFDVDRNWKFIENIKGIDEALISIARNKANKDEIELWMGAAMHGVIRLKLTEGKDAIIDKYDAFDGLTNGWNIPFEKNGNVIFGTQEGLFRFVHENEVMKALPDSLKNDKDFARGFFEPDTNSKTNEVAVNLYYENYGLSWFATSKQTTAMQLSYCSHEFPDTIISTPFKDLDQGRINTIYSDNSSTHWIGAADGLISYVINPEFSYDAGFEAHIRKVSLIRSDSVVFFGARYENSIPGSFAYAMNSLAFDYSASYYNHDVLYAYRLIGYDDDWSSFTDKTNKEYTNLHEGKYDFVVKAINKFGTESTVASYSFVIEKPWYRTVFAFVVYFILLVLIIYMIVLVGMHRLKVKNRKLEQLVLNRTAEIRMQKEEISSQYDLATKQRDLIGHQKKEITDSIHYASRIQNAVIPSSEFIANLINDYFILFKPKDIVSGDFYWAGKQNNTVIIIAADCTGHGVPGAFMSMLGTAFLNEIVNKEGITEPNEILNSLRKFVIKSLKQEHEQSKSKDGMDMSVFCLDTENNKLEYAGANNPLYLYRNNELIETKANKMPVAIYVKMEEFTKHEFQLEKGDTLYMFSDGYADQFGGPKNRKFMYKPFKRLLLEFQDKSMADQKDILDKAFEDWRGENEQIDDVLVVGIRI